MYYAYKFTYLISMILVLPVMINSVGGYGAKRDACLRRVAVQCPIFWGLVQPQPDQLNSDLSTVAVVADMPGVFKSCPAFRCVHKFTTPLDKCIANLFSADSRHHDIAAGASIEDYTMLARDMFNDASDNCRSLFRAK